VVCFEVKANRRQNKISRRVKLNRVEVLEKVGPLVDGQIRNINDSHGARVSIAGDVMSLRPRRGAQVVDVAPEGARAMVNLVGLPVGIAKSLSPKTFGEVLGELLDRAGSYAMVVKEDRLTDIVPYGRNALVAPERLLTIIEKVVPIREYNRVDLLPNRVASIEVVGERQAAVARGELVRAGVKINFSPMGTAAPLVQSYALVLACTNGATANNVLAEFTGGGGGEGDDIWHFFRQSIRQAYGSFEKVVEGWKRLRAENIRPEDRAQMLEALLKQARIGGKVAEAVRAMAIERPPRNSWEMHNLITYASSHLLEAAPAQRAQSTAANFADEERHPRTCPLCRRTR
jgi:hypothetical protein